jgi:tetratricopeptide (TPR) repeat protein
VRAALAAAAVTQESPPARLPPAPVPVSATSVASKSEIAATGPTPPLASAAAPAPLSPRSGRRLIAASAVVLALLIGVRALRPRPRPVSDPSRHAVVFPFRISDSTGSLGYLSEAMVDLLALKFAGDGQLTMVAPGAALAAWHDAGGRPDALPDARLQVAARRLGAARIFTGSAVGSGEVLTLSAAITDAATGRVLGGVDVRGSRDSIPVLVDRLAALLLLAATTGEPAALPELAGTPMAALRAYVAGEAAARDGRLDDAIRELRRALERDSTFALAALRLADAAEWVGPSWTWNAVEVKQEALRLGWKYRDRLSAADRALLEADAGPSFPIPSSEVAHLDAWSRAVQLAPDRAEAWLGFGDYLFHSGPLVGRSDAHRRAREAFARAAALDSGRVAALGHLADLDAVSGDTAHLRTVVAAYVRFSPRSELADFMRWRLAVGTNDTAGLAALRAQWDTMPVESLMRIATAMQMDGLQLDELDGISAALGRRLYESADAQQVNELLVDLALNQGRPQAAARRTRAWRERVSPDRIAVRLAGDALLAGGDRAAALEALAPVAASGHAAADVRCARALLYAGTDRQRAEQERRQLERAGVRNRPDDTLGIAGQSALCVMALDVLLARSGPGALEAVRRLDSAMLTGSPSFDVTMSGGENLIAAAAWQRLGRPAEALAAVRRRAYGGLWPTRFLADALREEGALALATADTAGALRAWRHYLALRTTVDTALALERDRVRTAIAALLPVSASLPSPGR